MKTVKMYLKKNREFSVGKGHPWVYSQAFKDIPANLKTGDLVEVFSHKNKSLGIGYADLESSILVRMLADDSQLKIKTLVNQLVSQAAELRHRFFGHDKTTAYRIINGEGDGIPGVIADKYDQAVALQIYSLGLEPMVEPICTAILQNFPEVKWIWRRDQIRRAKSGGAQLIHGKNMPEKIDFIENGLKYRTDLINGQKTGFFLDQRSNRELIRSISHGMRVLNICGYTGAFSVAAAAGGAKQTMTVDIAGPALEEALHNLRLNGFKAPDHATKTADMYDFLSSAASRNYDLIVVDPPSMAKNRRDLAKAINAYKRLNRLAIGAVQDHGYIFTASCTSQLSAEEFAQVVRDAATMAKRRLKIVSESFHAPDHPISLQHNEGKYLKGILLKVY